MTFGLRQKLAFGFGGLLAMLLLVSSLSVAVVARYRTALDRFFYENWRSVEYGRHITDSLQKLDELTESLQPQPTPADLAAARAQAAAPLADGDINCDAEDRNLTLDGEKRIAAALTLAWSGRSLDGHVLSNDTYRNAVNTVLNATTTASARAAALASVRRLSPVIRQQAQAVVELNVSNMRPIDGRAKELADRAILLMVAAAIAGTALAVVFTLLVARSILRPLGVVIRSIREIEAGNMDLVVHVPSHDEVRELAEAFNSMAAKLREFRRTNRAKLLRTQQTTQLAVNSLPDAVAVTSPDGTVELSNDAAQHLFGISAGANIAAVADRRLLEVYREVVTTERPSAVRGYESAIEVYDPGGQLRFFLPHAVPISDGESRVPVGVTLVLADVTNLRRLDEMKSGLLSVVSHELKTPLTSIRMAVHLLLEERVGVLNGKQVELLTAAREDSDRLDKIIAGLLDMGRMESGREEMDLTPESPEQLINETIEPLRAEFSDKGIAVHVRVPDDAPAVLIDPARINHVFSNLLTNAIKYTAPGGEVSVTAEAEGERFVRFTVADSGVGIPAEHLPRVFDRFFRVPDRKSPPGAGLGLAIAREIVLAHGGTIDAHSTPGEGARFSFTLRQAKNDLRLTAATPAATPASTPLPLPPPTSSPDRRLAALEVSS